MEFIVVIFPVEILNNTLHKGAKEREQKHGDDQVPEQKLKYQKSGVRELKSKSVWNALKNLLETEKPYLRADLDLKKLAGMVDVSPHVLSEVINVNAGCNFYQLIDRYRFSHAKSLLLQDQSRRRKLLDIALSSGYASQSNFFSHFKKHTGITPSQYRLGESHRRMEEMA